MARRSSAKKKPFFLFLLKWSVRAFWLFTRLAPYRVGAGVGAGLGFIMYYVNRRDRKRAIRHLSWAFPGRDQQWLRHTARGAFVHLGRAVMEMLLMNPRRLARLVDFPDSGVVARALERGKGMVWVTGHIGNWEVLGFKLASLFPLSVVAAPVDPEEANRLLVDVRAGGGVKTILRGRPGAARELIKVFRQNRILGILIDQDTDVEGTFVDFFGRPAWTPTAAAQMAIRMGAPLIFGYIIRGADGRHRVSVEGPLEPVRDAAGQPDVGATTAMLSGKLEACIAAHPEQWVWMHRRWKRAPPPPDWVT